MDRRETMIASAFQHGGLRDPCAGLNMEGETYRFIRELRCTIGTTDGVQTLLSEVARDAPLDRGPEGHTVPRPEGDDGVANGGLDDAVCFAGRRWTDGLTCPLSGFLLRGHFFFFMYLLHK